MNISQAVILVGGRGKRLEPITSKIPKPLVKVSGKPFIFHIFDQLNKYKFKEIVLLAGYKSQIFKRELLKYKSVYKNIRLLEQPENIETGARLILAKDYLEKNFFLLYGDNYCGLDLKKIISHYKKSKSLFQLLVYYDWNKYSKPNIHVNEKNIVKVYDPKRLKKKLNYVDIGYMCLNKKVLERFRFSKNLSLGEHIIGNSVKKKIVTAYKTYNLYTTVGTMERLKKARIMLSNRKFIFLDRDGVLNVKPKKGRYVSNTNEIKWKRGSLKALKLIKKKNYQTIIVTNQAGIGRRILKKDKVDKVNFKMSKDAKVNGGSIDYIYLCPHHWEDKCFCRKPSPGLFLNAQFDLNLDFSKICYIGDKKTDRNVAEKLDIKYFNLGNKDSLYKLIEKYL